MTDVTAGPPAAPAANGSSTAIEETSLTSTMVTLAVRSCSMMLTATVVQIMTRMETA